MPRYVAKMTTFSVGSWSHKAPSPRSNFSTLVSRWSGKMRSSSRIRSRSSGSARLTAIAAMSSLAVAANSPAAESEASSSSSSSSLLRSFTRKSARMASTRPRPTESSAISNSS
mgnify:CR=1 FL=1